MKTKIRDNITKRREGLSAIYIENYSKTLSEEFLESDSYKNAKNILSYMSFRGEIDTDFIHKRIFDDNKILILPKIYKNGIMKTYRVNDLSSLVKNSFGILEPQEHSELTPDLIIVPGVAFDKTGNRLGFGGGFYDRYLQNKSIKTIALCYNFQVVDELPKEEHDIPVDKLFFLEA